MKTLKELRMWHWRECLNYRRLQRNYESQAAAFKLGGYRNRAKLTIARTREKGANHHLTAVQILNDYLPDTTAEQDCAEADRLKEASRVLLADDDNKYNTQRGY